MRCFNSSFVICGNSGLASERIATLSSSGSISMRCFNCGNSGLASERIATFNSGAYRFLTPWGGNSGLASERIATPRGGRVRMPWGARGNSGLASERIATGRNTDDGVISQKPWEFRTRFREDCDAEIANVPIDQALLWEFRTRFREDCDQLAVGEHGDVESLVGIQDSLQRGLRQDRGLGRWCTKADIRGNSGLASERIATLRRRLERVTLL